MSQRKAKEYRQAMEQYRGAVEDVDDLKRRIGAMEARHRREDQLEEIRRRQARREAEQWEKKRKKSMFEADAHKNLIATGTAPTIESVQKMMMKLLRQTDPFGESIMVQPKYILVPVGYGFLMSQLLETAQVDVEGIGSHTANALYKYRTQLQVVEEGAINALAGSSAVPWYIVGDKTTAKSVQVDYLNGMETPSFRRSEKAGYLGFVWDIWLDWGITVMDYRGIVRNNGVAIAE